ncbi:fructosamine kinase family protein [Nocardioides yefusunii]|uniref:Fructosamine kinase family protein n=1 Tax=Nocardioides yefusunii TaxID=2500546 RepID=A0ABW1QVY1_9ACTN|nr:fructosamine kinase family protein [Nocardioides yefusunii]
MARRIEALVGTAVMSTSAVAGGDVAAATRARLSDGTSAFAKTLPHPPAGFFPAEAAGLRWLGAVDGGIPTPDVLGVDETCLVLRWIEPTRPSGEAAEEFGERLARTHAAGAPAFGAGGQDDPHTDGFIGKLPLPNRAAESWAEFYATRRVLPYLKLAADRGRISLTDAADVERVLSRLTQLVPHEPVARIHGDLWSGNCVWAVEGGVHVVDPAAHGGHRETDLAMLSLFGLPHLPKVMSAYESVTPLADGWRDRQWLHQLFPLLVHAAMFGGSYGAKAGDAARVFL